MKKRLVTAMAGLLMALGVLTIGTAWKWSPLPIEARASMGATHFVEFTFDDLTGTATNTAQVFTNAVPAKSAVEFVGMVLETAFDTGNTNFTGSVLLKIGDGSDDDLYMASTELASDGSEVFVKYGRRPDYTITPTLSTTRITNDVVNLVVTNFSAAAAAADLGRQSYNSAGIIRFTFTPNAEEALTSNTVGKVRIYFKVFDPASF